MNIEKKFPPLNPFQQQAVDHKDGPCIVLAGPGAGKTAVLTRRTANLVTNGVAPERILLLTFTRASAKEMLDRAKLLNSLCEKVDGGTFHSVATRIVNQNSHLFGRDKSFTILDPSDCLDSLKPIISMVKATCDEDWPQPSTIQRIISFSTNTRSSIGDAIMTVSPNYIHLEKSINEIRNQFFDYKIERGLLDYDDCLEYFAALLNDSDIGPKLRNKWDYILVDEYQDTNQLQLDIVYGLVSNKKSNIMIVGDPGQSIYSFRGSAPETMTGFRDKFPKSTVINLDVNYRSTPEIIDLVNAVDHRLGIGFNRTLVSNQPESDDLPILIESSNAFTQSTNLVDRILEHKNSGGRLDENAVIVRSMTYARNIELELAKRKVPYKIVGGLRIDEAAHVKDLLSIARVATNPKNEISWLRILSRFSKVGNKAATKIAEKMTRAETGLDSSDILMNEPKYSFLNLPKALVEFDRSDLTPARKLELVVDHMEPFWSTLKEWKEDWKDRKKDLEAIISIANDHPSIESFLTTITLDYSVDNKKTRESGSNYIDDLVTVTTVHGAKGLEWPRVHIPFFVSGHMPSAFSNDIKEEMRILYVAISRAKKELFLYKPNFSQNGSFNNSSEFEPMLRPHCHIEKLKKTNDNFKGRINSPKTIDMKSVVSKLRNAKSY